MSVRADSRATAPLWQVVGRLIRRDPWRYAATATFWVLWHAWALLPGLLAAAFFDTLQHHGPFGWDLGDAATAAAAAGLMRAALMLMAVRTGVALHFRTRVRIQLELLGLVLQHPGSGAARAPGGLLSTFRDDGERLALAIDWPFDALAGLVFWGVGITILWRVSPQLTATVFLPLVAVVGAASAARTRLTRLLADRRAATTRITGFLWDLWVGRDTLVAAGAETRAVQHLAHLNTERSLAELRDRRWLMALETMFSGTAQLGTALILLAAAAAMQQGRFSVGALALFATYLIQVAQYIGFVGYLMDSARDAGVAVHRLADAARPGSARTLGWGAVFSAASPPRSLPPLAEFTATVPAGSGARPVTIRLTPGRLTVITGGVGSGKTTLLRHLVGLEDDRVVLLTWNGVAIDPRQLRPPHAAYVPERPQFLSGSLRDNLLWTSSPSPRVVDTALARSALDATVARFPRGLDTPVGTGAQALSGGQATRLALARALVHAPGLLVTDSLTHALDANTEERLWHGLLDEGTAILAVSTRSGVLRRADDVIDLSGPLGSGRPQTLDSP